MNNNFALDLIIATILVLFIFACACLAALIRTGV